MLYLGKKQVIHYTSVGLTLRSLGHPLRLRHWLENEQNGKKHIYQKLIYKEKQQDLSISFIRQKFVFVLPNKLHSSWLISILKNKYGIIVYLELDIMKIIIQTNYKSNSLAALSLHIFIKT